MRTTETKRLIEVGYPHLKMGKLRITLSFIGFPLYMRLVTLIDIIMHPKAARPDLAINLKTGNSTFRYGAPLKHVKSVLLVFS